MAATEVGGAPPPEVDGLRAPEGLTPGSRIARLRASHSYGLVLVLVLVALVFTALAPDGDWSTSLRVVILATMLVVALWTSGVVRLTSWPIATLLIVAAFGALSPVVTGGRTFTGLLAIADSALVAATIAVIGLGAVDQREVNRQSLRAAIAVYLLFGLLFVSIYGGVAALASGPFFEQGIDGTTPQHWYFSFSTLATLGYGDFTAAGSLGHLLAVVEALIGQLYLVTVLAVLVGHLGQKRGGPDPR